MTFLQPAAKPQKQSQNLDLSFTVNENDLRHVTSQVPAEPTDKGIDSLFRVLCCCAERPAALSIAHENTEVVLLPTILNYMAHATGTVAACTADRVENAAATEVGFDALAWRDCGSSLQAELLE